MDDNPDYVYGTLAIKMENQAWHAEYDQQRIPKNCHVPSNKSAQPFFPHHMLTVSHTAPSTGHLAQYLSQQDLVISCLHQFDYKPEHYCA